VSEAAARKLRHQLSIIGELGLNYARSGDVVSGRAECVAEAVVPGTQTLRTSVIATWADVIAGAIAGHAIDPRIPLTLDLEVQLLGSATVGDQIVGESVAVKIGRTVVVCEASFRQESATDPFAIAIASFIASPNPEHVFEGGFPDFTGIPGRLSAPFAERAGLRVIEPGVAEVPRREDGLNGTGAIQGGILSLAAEQAALSLSPEPAVAVGLNMRYLRQFSIGPCRAEATGDARGSIVRLVDEGTGKVGAIATVRLGPPQF
jgi:acyl-coenzyme A thioesterase PaaI-like protein